MLAAIAVSEMAHACLCDILPSTEVVPQPVAACTNNKLSTSWCNSQGHVSVYIAWMVLASRH